MHRNVSVAATSSTPWKVLNAFSGEAARCSGVTSALMTTTFAVAPVPLRSSASASVQASAAALAAA